MVGGDPDSQFSIHPSTGKVKVAKALDYERKTQYELIIEAKDEGGPPKSSSTTLTINLLDESDSEPTCMDTFISVTVLETYLTGDQVRFNSAGISIHAKIRVSLMPVKMYMYIASKSSENIILNNYRSRNSVHAPLHIR